MLTHSCFTPLNRALSEGAMVVLPSSHLSHVLMNNCLLSRKQSIHAKPLCFSYSTFVSWMYEVCQEQNPEKNHPNLLTSAQAKHLWEVTGKQLQTNTSIQPFINDTFLAWKLCCDWDIDVNEYDFSLTPQTALFQNWVNAFELRLFESHFTTDAKLPAYLMTQTLNLKTKRIIFACFDDFNPQQLAMQQYLKQQGLHIEIFDFTPPPSQHTFQFEAKDKQSHQLSCLDWIKGHIQANHTVALLVPQLAQKGKRLQRWLQAHLPEVPLHFSLGQPLSDYTLIAHALTFISLFEQTLTQQEAQMLLRSSFLHNSENEALQRQVFASKDPSLQSVFLDVYLFLKNLESSCPLLAATLKACKPYPDEASPAIWSKLFKARLNAIGYPGKSGLNSENYQAFQRFSHCFEVFQSYALISPKLAKAQAFKLFKQLIEQTLFQPQQQANAPIHVLGLLEAAGVPFDAIWMMDMTEQHFPAKLTPTAFIPLALQQSLQMPHTNENQILKLASLRLNRFKNATPELICAYIQNEAAIEQRPTAFIQPYPKVQLQPSAIPLETIIESYSDPTRIPLSTTELSPKGTILLEEQAKCPFRAFAKVRLKAQPLEHPLLGCSPKTRGIVLHKAMEHFWENVKTQATLIDLDEEELNAVLITAVEKALDTQLTTIPPQLLQLEKRRLTTLLKTSFNFERARDDFKISALEAAYQIELGPITFNVRLDRIDELASGEQWVIDYKTALPSPLPWNEDEPTAPQLLLYALLSPKIKAILFHEIKNGKAQVKGCASSPNKELGLNAVKKGSSWDEQKANWKRYLTLLAQAFHEGQCEAMPKTEALCSRCTFQSLCRRPLRVLQ